jgi:hypothetical protein
VRSGVAVPPGGRILAQTNLPDGGTLNTSVPIPSAPPTGVWTHVAIDVDSSTSPATATVSYDGAPALTQAPLPAPCSGPATASVAVGAFDTGGPVELTFDNVTFDGAN